MRDNVENLRMDVLRVHMFADTNAARLSSTDYVAIKQVASALGDVLAGTEQVSEKCATESIALLRKYNQWRCGVIDSFDGNEGPNPRAITEAINSVCADTEAIRARVAELEAANEIKPDFYGYVWDYDNPEDSNEDTFGEYLDNQCDQEIGPILGMERRVMIARKLPDVLLTVTEVDEHNRPKAWNVEIIARPTVEVRRG